MTKKKTKTPPVDFGPAEFDDFDTKLFQGRHHARFIDPDTVHHVISRVFQGRYLMRPSSEINTIINGVIGRARRNWPSVEFFAHAFMSNHVHLMVRGPAFEITKFIGHLKREISRRCSPLAKWPRVAFWDPRYIATALTGAESQEQCLKYILSQGVKEGLVEDPVEWPGVHCAKQLFAKERVFGDWFDGTGYGKATYRAERRKKKKKHEEVDRNKFITKYEVTLDTLPVWRGLTNEQRERELARMRREIIAEGKAARNGKKAKGVKYVLSMPRETRTELPKQPWYEERRRMIFWGNAKAAETQDYLKRYWEFQAKFRLASDAYLAGNFAVEFPEGSFRPTCIVAAFLPDVLAA